MLNRIKNIINNYNFYRKNKKFLKRLNYKLNEDGSIDIYQNFNFSEHCRGEIPLKIRKVFGNFNASSSGLKNFNNFPDEITGHLNISYNRIESLENGPLVGGNYICSHNKIKSLKGIQKTINGNFECVNNSFINLIGSPTNINGNFDAVLNNLETLEGGPENIKGNVHINSKKLPIEIRENYKFIKFILKWADDYDIWRDGKLYVPRFNELLRDVRIIDLKDNSDMLIDTKVHLHGRQGISGRVGISGPQGISGPINGPQNVMGPQNVNIVR